MSKITMLLFALICTWWLNNTGSDHYVGIANEDINWTVGYKNLTGKNIKIVSMADGARFNHIIYKNRADKQQFLDAFYNTKLENPPEPLNTSQSIGQATLGLSSGYWDTLDGTGGVAPESTVQSFYFFDNNDHAESLQYVICHHSTEWDIAVLSYQYDTCKSDRFCVYVEPDSFTQQMVSKCLYSPSKGKKPKIFVVPVQHNRSSDVLFTPPARWPMMFVIGGTNNRGLPLDHGSEGAGVFMTCPVADRAPIPSASVIDDTAGLANFTTPNASAAIFAGGLAILLQVNENFTIPDLMFITAMTADQNQPDSVLWQDNAFGLMFNRRQGFGRLNLGKAVELAQNWKSVGGFYNISRQLDGISTRMENGSVNFTFSFEDPEIDEEATVLSVQLSIKGRSIGFGSLNPHVYSPNGTDCEMKILSESDIDLDIKNIELPSYKFLGDRVNGTWTVEFKQIDDANRGTLTSVGLTIFYCKKAPPQDQIQQRHGANPFTPIKSNGFAFNVTNSTMRATEQWSVPVTFPEELTFLLYILTPAISISPSILQFGTKSFILLNVFKRVDFPCVSCNHI